uniref:Uncharacterized protein n=1 Tax=Ditylenchus dipsaci TaxID=166011 RepID=A0A915DRD5_9BILA
MFIHFLHASSSHRPIPPLLSKFLYAFAVFNSALSPYLYGYFSFNIREELKLLLYCCSKPACFTSTGSGSPHSSQSAISIRDRRSTMANTHIMPHNSKEPYKSSGNSMSLPKSRFIQQQQRISSISLKHHNYVAKTSSHQSAGQRAKNLSFQLDAPRDYQPSPLSICEPEACLNGSTVQSLLLLTDDDGDNYSNTSSNAGARSQSFIAVNNNNNNMDEEEEEQDFNGDGSSGATESTAKQPLLLSPKVGTYRNAKWKHTNKLKDTEKQTIERRIKFKLTKE